MVCVRVPYQSRFSLSRSSSTRLVQFSVKKLPYRFSTPIPPVYLIPPLTIQLSSLPGYSFSNSKLILPGHLAQGLLLGFRVEFFQRTREQFLCYPVQGLGSSITLVFYSSPSDDSKGILGNKAGSQLNCF